MESWVDLGYPAVHRPGSELAIFRSRIRRPATTLPKQPIVCCFMGLAAWIIKMNEWMDEWINKLRIRILRILFFEFVIFFTNSNVPQSFET